MYVPNAKNVVVNPGLFAMHLNIKFQGIYIYCPVRRQKLPEIGTRRPRFGSVQWRNERCEVLGKEKGYITGVIYFR